MKKKSFIMLLCAIMVMSSVTFRTLAFLTDRDAVTNKFTVGNVDIEVKENYEPDSPLNPGVEVEKKAGIKNTHATSDTWVWMTVSVPAKLDSYVDLGWASIEGTKLDTPVHEGYVSYLAKHPTKLEPSDSTPKCLESVTLSVKVDYQDGAYAVVDGGQAGANGGAEPATEVATAEELAAGENVKLTNNITTGNIRIEEGVNATINLNGKALTATPTTTEGRTNYALDNYGTLTPAGSGEIIARGVQNFGTMTIEEGVKITANDKGGAARRNEFTRSCHFHRYG